MVDAYETLADLAYHAARSQRQTLTYDAPMHFWRDFVADKRVMEATTEPLQVGKAFPWFGVQVTVRIITPCGGCGEENPEKRCIGCLHKFVS